MPAEQEQGDQCLVARILGRRAMPDAEQPVGLIGRECAAVALDAGVRIEGALMTQSASMIRWLSSSDVRM